MVRSLLGWVFGPHVFELMAFFLAATGVAFMLTPSKEDIIRAHWFFGAAFVFIIGRVAQWIITIQNPYLPKIILAALMFAVIGAAWMMMYQIVESRAAKAELPQQPFLTEQKPFSVEVRSAAVSDTGPVTVFVMTLPGKVVSPVFYLSYLQIENLQDAPDTINDLTISVSKEPEGPWEDLVPMDLGTSTHTLFTLGSRGPVSPKFLKLFGTMRFAKPMTNDDLKFAAIVKAEPAMEVVISKPIPPHTPIRGWVALHSLRHVGLSPGQIYFRVKLSSTAKGQQRYVAELPKSGPQDTEMHGDSGQLDIVGITTDLSDFKIKYFREP